MDADSIQARIDYYTTLITAYEESLTALSSQGLKSYTLNTGQTTETVTKQDVWRIQQLLESALASLDYWDMRLNGGATIYVRPH